MRASVIDLGSNTAKLVNYNVGPDNIYRHYQDESIRTRLGEDLDSTGVLGDAAVLRTIDALKQFREIIDLQSIKHVLPVATSAVREAANGASFLQTILRETSFDFRILSDREEALYSYLGAARSLKLGSMTFFDLGGGSLELVQAEDFEIKRIVSLPLGALRLTQTYADRQDGSYSPKAVKQLRERILNLLPDKDELLKCDRLVGVGGTLRNIAKFHQAESGYPLSKIHNYSMEHSTVSKVSAKLLSMRPERIAKTEYVNSGRADIITAGGLVIDLLMDKLGFDRITVSAQALREGILDASLEFYKEFSSGHEVAKASIEQSVRNSSVPDVLPIYMAKLLSLLDSKMAKDAAVRILSHGMACMSEFKFESPAGVLHAAMDRDSHLEHREQLIAVLAAVLLRKKRLVDKICNDYSILLQPGDKKTIRKISSLLALYDTLYRAGADMSVRRLSGVILLEVQTPNYIVPKMLLSDIVKKIAASFDIQINYQIIGKVSGKMHT